MIRRASAETSGIELCPRCHAPHAAVRRATGCACAVVWCRCADGGATAHLIEDPTCRGCAVQRLAWRLHLVPERRRTE